CDGVHIRRLDHLRMLARNSMQVELAFDQSAPTQRHVAEIGSGPIGRISCEEIDTTVIDRRTVTALQAAPWRWIDRERRGCRRRAVMPAGVRRGNRRVQALEDGSGAGAQVAQSLGGLEMAELPKLPDPTGAKSQAAGITGAIGIEQSQQTHFIATLLQLL